MWHLPSNSTSRTVQRQQRPKASSAPCSASSSLQEAQKPTEASTRLCPGCAAGIIFPEEKKRMVKHIPNIPPKWHCVIPSTPTSASVLAWGHFGNGQTKELGRMWSTINILAYAKHWKKTFLPSSYTFLPFSFLLHWKNAIFLIIKVKVMADLAERSSIYFPVHALLQPCHKHHDLLSLGTNVYLNRKRLPNNMCFTGQYFVSFFSCPDKKNNAEKKSNRRHKEATYSTSVLHTV